ncbi:MAG: glycosyltransferase [Syntrophobacteraceae bacterium]
MKHKVNILHVSQYIEIGGLETLIVEMCKKIDKEIFNVDILCLNGFDDKYVENIRQFDIGISVIRKNYKFDYSFIRKVCRYINEKEIDVVHAHGGCFFYSALFSAFSKSKRFIYTAHGMPLSNDVKSILEDQIAGLFCDDIVAVSDEIHATFSHRIPGAKEKIKVIINGIDTDRFRPFPDDSRRVAMAERYRLPKDCFIVGSVGRLEPVKNYPLLLRAFARMEAEPGKRPSHLVLVGEGSQRAELEALAGNLGLSGRVSFLGMQYLVHDILPLFDAFVLSSFTEGTSISLLEAQACGVPAVVTDVGGNGLVVRHGENGFLCPSNEDAAMATDLRCLRDDPLPAQRMRAAARKRVTEEFDLDSMVRRYEELYLKAGSAISGK